MHYWRARLLKIDNYLWLIAILMIIQVGLLFVLKLPLFTSDSGAYLLNTHVQDLPMDRPVFYSWFIALFKNSGLRYLAIIQAFVLAVLFAQVLNHLGILNNRKVLFMAVFAFVFSGLPLIALQVMPDAFTAAMLLALYLMFSSSGIKAIRYSLLVAAFCTFHFSHVAIVLICTVFWFLKHPKRRNILYFIAPLVSILLMSWVNFKGGLGFKPSPASHVYFMGKMVENGIAQRYLDENCTKSNYALCAYKSELHGHAWDFVWSPNGAFTATGGWHKSATEYNAIIKQTLLQPKYLLMHLQAAFLATFHQIWRSQLGDGIVPMDLKSNVFEHLANSIPRDLYLFPKSLQNSKTGLPWETINDTTRAICLLSIVLLLTLWLGRFLNPKTAVFITLICVFVLANAFVTGALANILSRLNSRALLVLPALILPIYTARFVK